MKVISLILYVLVGSSIAITGEKFELSIVEIRDISDEISYELIEDLSSSGNWTQEAEDKIYEDYLVSVGVDLVLRKAKIRSARETLENYIRIDDRKRIEPIVIHKRWINGKDTSFDEIDPYWRMAAVKIDTDENIRRGFYNKKCLIFRDEVLRDSITVNFAIGVARPGFVPKQTFTQNGIPVISYHSKRGHEIWFNGENLSDKYGLDEAIVPGFINGKFFFVFEKDDKWGWSYDGEMHYDVWDRVGDTCGGQGMPWGISPPSIQKGFTALRGGIQYTCKPVIKVISE